MKSRSTALGAAMALLVLAASAPASAAALPDGWSLSGEAALVSDYRFRGISLSDRRAAVQGGLTLEHEFGLYGALWGSTIAESEGGADAEIDLVAGFATELAGGVSLDLSVSHYLYPSDPDISFTEAAASLSRGFGAATPRIGIAYAPAQGTMRDDFGVRRDNVYAFAGVELALPGLPVTLDGEIGYESGYFDVCDTGGKTDWRIGASLDLAGFAFGLQYVDSDSRLPGLHGRDLAGATVVASLAVSF